MLREPFSNRRRALILASACLCMAVLVAWWLWPGKGAPAGMHAITVKAADGTERKVLLNGIGPDLGNNPMQGRLDGYFALQTREERNLYLDAIIDEAEAASAEFGDLAARIRQAGSPEEVSKALENSGPGQKAAVVMRPDDKSMAENIPAEFQAQMAEFARAVAERRKERGLPPGPLMFRHRV